MSIALQCVFSFYNVHLYFVCVLVAPSEAKHIGDNTGRFIMFFVITNIYNKKTKGSTLMELFTATGKLKKIFF